ncbi:phage holin family protein [Klebsiella pneumoniae]|uniref:HP1 family phage holin n=1 Tax=Klebsiella pneumoniae complex TaxID=3390273 RepID=UPI0010364FBD|nr:MULTISPECIES: HP1 family phage holin [Klebsiella]MCQ8564039.1 phage holin family protein [Klebsiella pneumoniae]TBP35389.1 holin [Klebsiella quasipneumoniae subsp. quasipneumoniae]TBP63871.1 holin [Klebsiella quasipneumoniae subsp. quasipneumoniae]TBQ05892.1 holin [Klebsiella quasipneumoniae subsp. quasipneumoniae]TBQ62454.1 holin [Klebsiella quasipneumoniae subsp. quasipneumoniae]
MGLNIEKITSFIAYWLSVALAAFGAMTPQDFAAWFGVLGVVMTVGVNWYYRRKSYLLELNRCAHRPIVVAPPPKRP